MAKTIPAEEKVFMVSKSTNTTYSGSAALKAMQEWYTMDDVTNTVRPYKVFTALLTQSGGDNPRGNGSDDPYPLEIGVTYSIDVNDGTGDFTNVGAPNNNVGTYFIATGTTPNNWGTPGDVTLGYNIGAPVATVLENTIGNIWFTYVDVGNYSVNSSGLFLSNKTYQNPVNYNLPNDITEGYNFTVIDEDACAFLVVQGGILQDYSLTNAPIEIRVYS